MDENRAARVQQVLGTARATLARSRANNQYGNVTNNNISSCANDEQFREQPAEVPGAPGRSRSRPLAPRDRTPPAPPCETETPTWAEDRAAVFEAISSLRELCETLTDQLAAIRWRQVGSVFDTPQVAFGELSRWAREDRARIEAAGSSRDNQGKEERSTAANDAVGSGVSSARAGPAGPGKGY